MANKLMGNANTDTKDLTHSQRHATQSQILDATQTRGQTGHRVHWERVMETSPWDT